MLGETLCITLRDDEMGSGQVSEVVHVRNLDIIQSEDFNTQQPHFQASRWLAGISTQVSLSISHLVGFQARSLTSSSSKSSLLPKQTVKKDLSSQFSSVQLLGHVRLFATPWAVACQASLSITNSWSLLKLMSIESVNPSNHLILCRPLLLLPSIFPSIRVFSNKSVLRIRWSKY